MHMPQESLAPALESPGSLALFASRDYYETVFLWCIQIVEPALDSIWYFNA